MAPDLYSSVEALLRGFRALPASPAAAERLLSEAEALQDATGSVGYLRRLDQRKLRRKVGELAGRVGSLEAALTSALAQTAQQAAALPAQPPMFRGSFLRSPDAAPLLTYFDAVCVTATACASVALDLGWQQDDASTRACAGAARTVLAAGRWALQAQLAPEWGQAGIPDDFAELLWQSCHFQLAALNAGMSHLCNPQRHPRLAAHFAASVGPPGLLLPWLAAVSQSLMLVKEVVPQDIGSLVLDTVNFYSGLINQLTGSPQYRAHQQQLLAGGGGQQAAAAVVDTLLLCVLPRIAAVLQEQQGAAAAQAEAAAGPAAAAARASGTRSSGASGGSGAGSADAADRAGKACSALGVLYTSLEADCLQPAIYERQLPPGALPAVVRATAGIAGALPTRAQARVPAEIIQMLHSFVGRLLVMAAQIGLGQPHPQPLTDDPHSMPSGGSSGSSGSDASRERPAASDAAREVEQAAWEFLRLLPALARVLPALAAAFPRPEYLARIVDDYSYAAQLLRYLPARFDSSEQIAEWAAASEAMLRLLPVLSKLDASWRQPLQGRRRQQGGSRGHAAAALPEDLQQAAAALAEELLASVWRSGGAAVNMWARVLEPLPAWLEDNSIGASSNSDSAASPRPPPPALGQQLWQLHTTGCRAVHALVARHAQHGQHELMWNRLSSWKALLRGLLGLLPAVHAGLCLAEQPGTRSAQQYQGSLAAHLEALQAAGAVVEQLEPEEAGFVLFVMCSAVTAAPATCPQLTDPVWTFRLQQLVQALMHSRQSLNDLRWVLIRGEQEPRLAAALADSGALDDIAKHLELLGQSSGSDDETEDTVNLCWMALFHALDALREAAADAAEQLGRAGGEQASDGAPPSPGTGSSTTAGTAAGSGCGTIAAGAAAGGSSSGLQGSAMPDRRELAFGLLAAVLEVKRAQHPSEQGGADEPEGSEAHTIEALVGVCQRRLPPATQLARLLLRFWALPEQQAEAQLQLARAAATRSCAYLRCANLGNSGGPGAGQGAGSLRCSACRAVWYCGTQCSHADWRAGGHKRVCKALAADRQQQQQQASDQA